MNRQKGMDVINELAANLGLFSRQPNMRYFSLPDDPRRFCWTTEKADGKYWAALYRIRKDGAWVLKKRRGYKHRASAKRCAKRWKERARSCRV